MCCRSEIGFATDPHYSFHKSPKGERAKDTIRLLIDATAREGTSGHMRNGLYRAHAALDACKNLYKERTVNEHLLPRGTVKSCDIVGGTLTAEMEKRITSERRIARVKAYDPEFPMCQKEPHSAANLRLIARQRQSSASTNGILTPDVILENGWNSFDFPSGEKLLELRHLKSIHLLHSEGEIATEHACRARLTAMNRAQKKFFEQENF